MSENTSPFRIEPTEGGFRLAFDVNTVKGEGQTKIATFGQFEILCDESAMIGGNDSAPPPLAFFAASVAF